MRNWRLMILLLVAVSITCEAQTTPPAGPFTYVFPIFIDGTFNGTVYKSAVSVLPVVPTLLANMSCTVTQRQTMTQLVGAQGDKYQMISQYGGIELETVSPILPAEPLQWDLLTSSGATPLKSGYVSVSCLQDFHTDLHISLYGSGGTKIDESALVPAVKGTSFEFLIDMRTGSRLGLSLINDSAVNGQPYQVIARDQLNNIVSGPQIV